MRALSIKQPWAWAILHAGKDVENRNWRTNYRGRILIHAGRKIDMDGWNWLLENKKLPEFVGPDDYRNLQTGGFVGTVEIVDCADEMDSEWFFGPYGFVLQDPQPIDFVSYRGKLGLFEVPEDDLPSVLHGS